MCFPKICSILQRDALTLALCSLILFALGCENLPQPKVGAPKVILGPSPSGPSDPEYLNNSPGTTLYYRDVRFVGPSVYSIRRYYNRWYNKSSSDSKDINEASEKDYSYIPQITEGNNGAYLIWGERFQPSQMKKIENDGSNLPEADYLMVFENTASNPYGHVAIVSSVIDKNNRKVRIIDSDWNGTQSGYEHEITISSAIQGWFAPIQGGDEWREIIGPTANWVLQDDQGTCSRMTNTDSSIYIINIDGPASDAARCQLKYIGPKYANGFPVTFGSYKFCARVTVLFGQWSRYSLQLSDIATGWSNHGYVDRMETDGRERCVQIEEESDLQQGQLSVMLGSFYSSTVRIVPRFLTTK